MSEEIDFEDIEFGEPIEKKEPNYRDGYIQGIYRARNIIDSKQKEIERLNNIINELESYSEKKIEEYSKKIEELDNTDKISMLCVRSAYRDISNKIKGSVKG